MAKLSKLSIGVTVSGDGTTTTYAPPGNPFENAAAPNGGTVDFDLAMGVNTIPIPSGGAAGAVGVVIVPPAGSANAKILKGVGGDTGFTIHANRPTVLSFDPATTDFVIDSAGAETIELQWL